jgi:hypothetical protein
MSAHQEKAMLDLARIAEESSAERDRLRAVNAELVEACRMAYARLGESAPYLRAAIAKADAAIARAEGR